MKQKAIYQEKQPNVLYQVINPHKVDIIVNKYIGKEQMVSGIDEETQEVFAYEFNSFSANPDEITEEMVNNNIDYYLDYETPNESVEQKISRLEKENKLLLDCIVELSEVVYGG